MRLQEVQRLKDHHRGSIQELPKAEIKQSGHDLNVLILRESIKRKLARALGPYYLQHQKARIKKVKLKTSFSYDMASWGERFSTDSSLAILLKKLFVNPSHRILINGCNTGHGEDVQFWLQQGFRRVDGVDLYSFEKEWPIVSHALGRHYKATLAFSQAAIEAMPYPNNTFDLLVSNAILEHIHNVEAALQETSRVLKPEGIAWHAFGPLYFSYAGDHCISSYGFDHGYDHLLLNETDYRKRVSNRSFYDTQPDPQNNFWAMTDQFSFLRPGEYISLLEKYFKIEHLLIKISLEGLQFEERFVDRWNQLKMAGLSEEDLLISGMLVILRKKRE